MDLYLERVEDCMVKLNQSFVSPQRRIAFNLESHLFGDNLLSDIFEKVLF